MRTAKTEKRLDDPSRLPINVDDIAAGDADASHATSPTMAMVKS